MIRELPGALLYEDRQPMLLFISGFCTLISAVVFMPGVSGDIMIGRLLFFVMLAIFLFCPWKKQTFFDSSRRVVVISRQSLLIKKYSSREIPFAGVQEVRIAYFNCRDVGENGNQYAYGIILLLLDGKTVGLHMGLRVKRTLARGLKMRSEGIPTDYPGWEASQARKVAEFIGVPFDEKILGI